MSSSATIACDYAIRHKKNSPLLSKRQGVSDLAQKLAAVQGASRETGVPRGARIAQNEDDHRARPRGAEAASLDKDALPGYRREWGRLG